MNACVVLFLSYESIVWACDNIPVSVFFIRTQQNISTAAYQQDYPRHTIHFSALSVHIHDQPIVSSRIGLNLQSYNWAYCLLLLIDLPTAQYYLLLRLLDLGARIVKMYCKERNHAHVFKYGCEKNIIYSCASNFVPRYENEIISCLWKRVQHCVHNFQKKNNYTWLVKHRFSWCEISHWHTNMIARS